MMKNNTFSNLFLRPMVGKLDDERIKEKDIEELTNEKVLGFEFKNIKVKVDSRKTSAKDGEVNKFVYVSLMFRNTVIISTSINILVSLRNWQTVYICVIAVLSIAL